LRFNNRPMNQVRNACAVCALSHAHAHTHTRARAHTRARVRCEL
jgi:hypothetical protein